MTNNGGILSVSITDLARNLHRISEAHPGKDSTLAEFVSDRGFAPIWSDNVIEQAAITARLVELTKPELDAGALDIGALDLDPNRSADKFGYPLRQVVEALHRRREQLRAAIGLANYGRYDAANVIAAVASRGLSQDEFRFVAEHVYLTELTHGDYDTAKTLVSNFSAKPQGGNAWFDPAVIASDYLAAAIKQCGIKAMQYIIERPSFAKGIKQCTELVAIGWLTQEQVDQKIHDRLTYYRAVDGSCSEPELEPYAHLVSDAERANFKSRSLAHTFAELRRMDESTDPQPLVERLRLLGVDEDGINAAVKDAYLQVIRRYGDVPVLAEYRQLLTVVASSNQPCQANAVPEPVAPLVTEAEITEAFTQYADRLAENGSASEDWRKKAAAVSKYFRPGAYDRAVLTAGYFARYGYWASKESFDEVRKAFPDANWDNLANLQPPCLCGGIDLRAAVLARLNCFTERTLANVLFNFLGSVHDCSSLGTFINFVRQSLAVAIGLPRETLPDFVDSLFKFTDRMAVVEGHDTVTAQAARKDRRDQEEIIRARLVAEAFGAALPTAMPYGAFLNLRRLVAVLVRQHANMEID
jgi:hypothetical protein